MASILLVHDHPTVRHVLRSYLERGAHEVTTAATARHALEAAGPHIDVVVTDIELSGMAGMGLVDRLRRRNLCAPVVLLSDRFLHAEEAAAAAFVLLEPFAPEELLGAVDSALGSVSAPAEAVAV